MSTKMFIVVSLSGIIMDFHMTFFSISFHLTFKKYCYIFNSFCVIKLYPRLNACETIMKDSTPCLNLKLYFKDEPLVLMLEFNIVLSKS